MKEVNSNPQSTWTCGIRRGEFRAEILFRHKNRNVTVFCNRMKKPEASRVTAKLHAFKKVQGTVEFIWSRHNRSFGGLRQIVSDRTGACLLSTAVN
jgi:hypothetical protein